MDQMKEVAAGMPGQLTSSIMATEAECLMHQDLLNEIRLHAGRIILNAVPTGVEVTQAMHHGGLFPQVPIAALPPWAPMPSAGFTTGLLSELAR